MSDVMDFKKNVNQERMKAWIEELRSGGRAQTRGTLAKIDAEGVACSFCCLGVLSDLAADQGAVPREPNFEYEEMTYGSEKRGGMPPDEVSQWIGFVDDDGFTGNFVVPVDERLRIELKARDVYEGIIELDKDDNELVEISLLNDRAKLTFAEIADVLERVFITGDERNG